MEKKQYKALKPVGRFKKGDFIGDLPDYQIAELLKNKVITEVTKDESPKPQLKKEG